MSAAIGSVSGRFLPFGPCSLYVSVSPTKVGALTGPSIDLGREPGRDPSSGIAGGWNGRLLARRRERADAAGDAAPVATTRAAR